MPEHTYMGVDRRRDHSFRIPRPELAAEISAPNACGGCHSQKSLEWVKTAFKRWYPALPGGSWPERYGRALSAGRKGQPESEAKLSEVAGDSSLPGIVRATAFVELQRYLSPRSYSTVQNGLKDSDPLVRLGALRALSNISPNVHSADSVELLKDPVRAVRIEAASRLADAVPEQLTADQAQTLDTAIKEYVAAEMVSADRPEMQLNLGILYMRMGNMAQAEAHYRQAFKLDPSFSPAYVNLGDLLRMAGRDQEGETMLRKAAEATSNDPGITHALGLLLVRQKKNEEALVWLRRAADASPQNSRFAYVYAVALQSMGRVSDALEVLARAQKEHPYDQQIVAAIVSMRQEAEKP